jgi:hypothetical protein
MSLGQGRLYTEQEVQEILLISSMSKLYSVALELAGRQDVPPKELLEYKTTLLQMMKKYQSIFTGQIMELEHPDFFKKF